MMLPNSLGDPPPSEKTGPVIESEDISPLVTCEDQKIAAPVQITMSLPSLDTSAVAEAQGSSSPASEDQIMAAPDQITDSLPSQDASATAEAQGSSSPAPACEDQIMDTLGHITEPLPSYHTSAAAAAQGTSAQAVTEDRQMAPPDSVMEFSNIQIAIASQDYSSQNVTEDEEMEAADITEAPLPSQDTGTATKPRDSSWGVTEDQDKQEVAVGDSGESDPLPSQKVSTTIETQESAPLLVSKESVTASLQPSLQNESRNPTPVLGDRIGNTSPVQDVRPLIPPTSADDMVKGPPRSTMPGEICIMPCVTCLVLDLFKLVKGNLGKRCVLSQWDKA